MRVMVRGSKAFIESSRMQGNALCWRMASHWPWASSPTFLRNSRFKPFLEHEPFASKADLGPFEWQRDLQDHERFGYTNGPAYVDPQTGLIVEEPARLLRYGKIDIHSVLPPSFPAFCKARLRQAEIRDVGEVIKLRDSAEVNYYHFMIDIIGGSLRLADELGLFPGLPILMGRRVFEERRYCRDVIRLMEISEEQIIFQDNRPGSAWWARSERLCFADPPRRSLENLRYLWRALRVPDSDTASKRRIFLIREPKYGRGIKNLDQVVEVANRFGFEIFGTADMSIEQQRDVFSEARYVIGVHGAGLTNLFFRKNAACSLLEIFPPSVNHPRSHFYFMAEVLGFHYDLLLGPGGGNRAPLDYKGNFDIDIANLTSAIRRMLDQT
jgi:hypothetical protein